LPVVLQKSWTLRTARWRYAEYREVSHLHLPLDTMAQLSRYRPDAILSGELGFRTLAAWIYSRMHRHIAYVPWLDLAMYTEQDVGRLRTRFRKLLLSGARAIVTNGVSGSQYACALGVPKHLVFESPFTVPVEEFSSAPVPRPAHLAKKFLYAGQFIERKGLLPFLEALRRYCLQHPEQSVQFRLVGSGPLRPALESYAVPANLHLEIADWLPYSQLVEEYAGAGIFVLPTFSDTWGMVASEAMASGIPVLGSECAQAVEQLVQEGVNGWRFHPASPSSLQSAIERALSTPVERLAQMQEAARRTLQEVTVDRSADIMIRALLQASGHCGRA
jgi:glycosyltransferase involved in cell wall biosynthesis